MAWVNVPGCLPMEDDPPTFDTATEAWKWLADERMISEETMACRGCDDPACKWGEWAPYSSTVADLLLLGEQSDRAKAGVIYGETPGYHGDHDLGLAYRVVRLDN